MKTMNRPWMLCAMAGLALSALLVAAPSVAQAGPSVGFEYTKAPATTHVAAYTTFAGTKNQFSNKSLDVWKSTFSFTGELAMPFFKQLSVFGDINYIYNNASNTPSGWTDANIGAKFAFMNSDTFAFAVLAKVVLPIGAKAVDVLKYEKVSGGIAASAGVSLGPVLNFGVHAAVDLGAVYKLEQVAGGDTSAVEFNFLVETVLGIPVVTGRMGITGIYRDKGFDKAAFKFYAEVDVLMFFLRVSLPFDVNNAFASVQQNLESSELLVLFGVNIGIDL